MFRVVIVKWNSGEAAFIHVFSVGFPCFGSIYLSGTVERQPSYIVFSVGLHVYDCYR